MPRQTADRFVISDAKIIPHRTRSGSTASTPLSGYISTPITAYRVAMEPNEQFESKLERISLAIDSYKSNFTYNEGWQRAYVDTYNKFTKSLNELRSQAPESSKEVVNSLTRTLDEAKEAMDKQIEEEPGDKQHEPQVEPLKSGQGDTRLLSESSEMFLDTTAESDMLTSLRYLAKGVPNLDRISKLSTNTANVTIGQQHALRVVRTDLRAISKTVDQLGTTGPRITNIETQLVNMQASLNNSITSGLRQSTALEAKYEERFKVMVDRILALESTIQTPIPPASSTLNASNHYSDPAGSGSPPRQPEEGAGTLTLPRATAKHLISQNQVMMLEKY